MKYLLLFFLILQNNVWAQKQIISSVAKSVAQETAQTAIVKRAICYFNGKDSKGKLKPECGGVKEEEKKEAEYKCQYCDPVETEDEPLSELCQVQCPMIKQLLSDHPMDVLNSRYTSPGAAFFNAKAAAKGCKCPE